MATVKLDPAKGIQIPNLTTTERNAISSPETGAIIWNTTTSEINQYNGSAWEITYTDTSVAGITSSADATAITIDSSERVGIGVTNPAVTLELAGNGGALRVPTGGELQFGGSANKIYGHASNNYLRFDTNGTERMRITDNGLTFKGDTAAANALDDYEEGSWNPAFTGSSGSIGSTNVGEWEGYYTRIGRLVTVQFKITLSNKGSWSGEVRLTGLPYSVQVTLPAAGTCAIANVNYSGGSVGSINIYVTAGVTYFRPRYTHDNDVQAMVQVSECTNTSQFQGQFSYITVAS